MISSAKNEQIKRVIELQKKARARNEAGLFLVEGIRMIAELPAERTEKLYVSEGFLNGLSDADAEKLPASVPREVVTDSVFSAMSDTRTPQGVLAVVRQYDHSLEEILSQKGPALLMILENIQDPGNLGTIIRAGEGAGITGVIMSRDTVDIYNPKVIRSTMGSVFRVPFCYAEDLFGAVRTVKESGVRLLAAHLNGTACYDEERLATDVGFLIGNEGNGLTDGLTALADGLVKIPMAGRVESLNAAVAASILMFETARQRRGA